MQKNNPYARPLDQPADRAIVRVLIFSNWKGFIRRTYTIGREFPHEIMDVKDETLVEYHCGVQI